MSAPPRDQGKAVPGWSQEYGTRLAAIIERLGGLTSAARVAGVSDESLAGWRDGRARPNFFGVSKLSSAAGVSLEWLANGEGLMVSPPAGATPPAAPPTSPSTTAGLDENLIRDCIVGTEMYLEETNRYLQPEKKAQLIIALYHLIAEKQLNEKLTNTPSDRSVIIDRLFKLAS